MICNIHSEPTPGTFNGRAANNSSQSWPIQVEYMNFTIARTEARTGFAAWKIRSSMTLYMAQSGTENREKPTEMIQIESGQS